MGMSDTQLRPPSELATPGEASYRASTLKVRVLGPLEVLSDGASVRLGGPKQRTVLALLAAEVGKPVSVDTLIDGVWGDEPTAGARSTLQTYVSNLRAAIGDVIVRDDGGYRLAADPAEVDAVEFERTVEHAAALVETDPVEAAQLLRAALALWRGHPFADVPGCFVLELEARRLEELRLRAVETRIEAELVLGGHAQLIAELEVLCEEFPTYERFRVQHMLALYRSGRQAEALRVYQKARAYLAEELGLEPSAQLQELERRILNQDPELEAEPQVQTLAFLLTDIEGSTVLWELYTNAMRAAVAEHDRIVLGAAEAAGGRLVKRVGDGIDLVFADAGAAVAAASQIQGDLAAVLSSEIEPLRVRMAIDVGEVEARGGDYFGPVLNRAGRMLAAAHGGQVLLSGDAHAALSASSGGWQAKALGEFRFKGLGSPQHVFQLLLDGLPADFPPLRIDRLPPALGPGAFGHSVRGYELREQVGGSDLGVVYRAYQPTVGREVAIKVIRPELVNQPSFVRGFESEAQLVAQLEHPHLVPLYDYWRDPEGAYLVMRWLRGGSLRQALDRGPWNLEPASRLLSQVGGALAYAHRQGAVHRNLKPANVLLDGDGNGYLADFGIAARLADSEDAGRPVVSPPAYVSPEELAGEPLTPRSDIYGLGLLTFEVLTGQRPPMDGPLPPVRSVRPELPPALDEVVACAAASDPDERYESVDRFLAAFDAAVGGAAPVAETYTSVENPYKGLRAFGEADAADFYGRDALVGELVRALVDRRLVAVVGPSGIGKSSIVKAGLVPSLRRRALPGSEQWLVTDMFPGSYPYEELAAALLRVAVERPDDLVEELERDELGIRRVMKRILPTESELLLVVDQFEELFTLTADEETRRRFLAGLTALAADPRSPVRVLVTLRADFLDHPLRYPEFGELLRAGMVAVAAPSEDELAEAIERPARRVGVRYEPGLVSQIVADVRDQPGALPLLQYALTELFAARTSDTLTHEGYVATGGVVGALGRRAEGLYARLRPPAQAASRQVFVRLVSVDPTAQDTRRRVSRRELRQLELDPDAVAEIMARYGEHRLLSFDREPLTRTPTVEVAHEAILSQWDRLRGWIDERREGLLLHRRLVEAVAEWQDAGRDPGYLPHENRLVQFEAWAGATDLALTAGERQFLAEARAAADTAARRRARRRQATLVGFALLAAAASVLATFALVLRNDARDDARLATARQLAASAEANLDVDPERSILLAIEAAETTRRHDGTVLPDSEHALHDALATSRVLTAVHGVGRRTGIGHVVALAPDASRFVAADLHGETASIRDAHTGAKLVTLAAHKGEVLAVAYSLDGRLVATGSADGTARLWNAVTGDPVHVLRAHRGGVFATGFSADGTRLATLGADRAVRVWDVRTGRELRSFPRVHQRTVAGVAWGEGVAFVGRDRIAVSPWARGSAPSPVVAKVFDVSSGKQVAVVEDPAGATEIVDLDVSPGGTLLVAGRADGGELQLYGLPSGRQLDVVQAHGATVLDVEFSRDGRLVATGGVDGLAKVWEVSRGKLSEALTLRGHTNPVGSVSFDRTGTRLATWGQISGEARVWDVSPAGRGEVLTLPGPKTDTQGSIAFTPDGRRLVASSGREGEVRVWSVETGRELFVLDQDARADAPVRAVVGVDVSPDGSRIATASADGSVRIFDAETGEQLLVVRGLHCVPGGLCVVNRAVFSPDGTRIATTGADATVRILDAGTGRQLRVLRGHRPGGFGTFSVEWSPDGTRLLSMAPDGPRIWDARSGRQLRALPPSGGPGFSAVWSPDARRVLTESGIGPKVWDPSSGKRLRTLETDAASGDMAFSRDRSRLAIVTLDGRAFATRIWDWPAAVATLKLREGGYGVTFSPDGRLLAGVRQEPVPFVHVWALDPEHLLRIARSRVTRSLTDDECRRYLQRPCSDEG
jgi:WD40 repeat protein/DNA-binding SARP family transcriptional activator